MKRRVLKKWVEWLIIAIAFITVFIICNLKEELALKEFITISIIGIIIELVCMFLLYKYGRSNE